MKELGKLLSVTLCFGLIGLAMSLIPQKAASVPRDGDPTPVTVTNPALAVRQTGPWNVGVTGTPTVNVASLPAITGNVSATILGTPTVNVASMPSLGNLSVQPTYTQPVTITASEVFAEAGGFASAFVAYTVPPGKRLILQYISGEIFLPPSQYVPQEVVRIFDSQKNEIASAYLTPPPNVDCGAGCAPNTWISTFSQQITIYAEAGHTVNFYALRNDHTGTGSVFLNAIGYLVDQ